ncbi:NADH-dependent flavin oxidoreductase [Amphibacillus indicireducens]|uniref:NADH-dependent flavin oxidoreductase n=1 Tax=Amphibacillus indicireducens TaxID=1076330 RepID=A0ABP7V949_9BACI
MAELKQSITFKRGLTLKNRIVMAPMTTSMSFFDGVITSDECAYYALRSGEVGAVITGAANVQANGKTWEGQLGVYHDRHITGLSKLAGSIKQNGTRAILQIFHGGRMTNSKILRGVQPVSASAVAAERSAAEIPRELLPDEILALIDDFKQATIRALKAGFDGVEIHGANTYLIQQFFSPHSNRRTDEWGGSREKRFKLINDLVDAVTSAVDQSGKKDFIVGYRFSPEEFETPGISLDDTLYLIDQLADKPLDYLHISINDYQRISVSEVYQEKPMINYIYQAINGRVPFIGVGDIRSKQQADEVLTTADLVALGRALLIEPHWVDKVFDKKTELIRTEINKYDREELLLGNGVWSFMEGLMPERLIE